MLNETLSVIFKHCAKSLDSPQKTYENWKVVQRKYEKNLIQIDSNHRYSFHHNPIHGLFLLVFVNM